MCVQRPIHVSTAITRTSWYRLMRPVKERSSLEAGIEVREKEGEIEAEIGKREKGKERGWGESKIGKARE